MATTWCPDLSADAAITLVGSAHDKFMELGATTYNMAVSNLQGLNSVRLDPIDFNVDFRFADPQATFQRPRRPDLDEGALEFRAPDVPLPSAPGFVAAPISISEAPELDAQPPTLAFGAKPTTPNVVEPTLPVDPAPIVLPAEPTYVLPQVPTFEALNLPDVPNIVLPEFEAEKPIFIEPPFNETWQFEATPYVSTLVDTLTATLKPMIVGSQALPRIIEDAIFQRARSRIELDTQRNVDQAVSEFAARGFSEPQGMLAGRILEVRQTGQGAVAEASRDAAIKQFEESLANQRMAIAQGAALEGTLAQLHTDEQKLMLQAATFQRETVIAVLNARISVFNARLQAYQTDAQVLRDRIQAELAKVEVFRAQIEGERARGEINEQRVRLYESQLRGVTTLADFYRTRVEAVKVQADINRFGIDKYRAQVDAYEARWRAHVAEWQGYTASVEGEGKRADLYRTLVDANAKRVDAWAASNNMQFEAERLRMAQHGVDLDVWRAGITRWDATLSGERARLAAVGQAFDAKARIYSADAGVEQAASAAADRSFELGLARERADVDVQLQQAQMRIQQMLGLLTQSAEIQRAKAQISSQLAASTMSAVNYGASVSSGRSKSNSCSQNYSFQGEIADA
ncbi:hypothetical protein I5W36_16030 [Stenotrophomonas maltophilia]|uniref:hypothetical protein n=2 Tax=Stenotrophomonas TaxID=40323 RepID=UPI0013106B69|nr:hypothetical protein [Stenotrophomonas sp. 232]MBF9137472.1 hypothetical protein [Stenotrophomonas sp. 232]MBH1517173.1 hypothetical protein [Stenotrophomonas maltophilia]MBH1778128.1 hypothetical protein [Stenotrophomonas maltophilia]